MEEARRCLQCKHSQCGVQCPVRIHVRNSILLFVKSRFVEAEKQLLENKMLTPERLVEEGRERSAGVISFPLKAMVLDRYYEDCGLHVYAAASPEPVFSRSGRRSPGPYCTGCCQDWKELP